MIKTTAITVFLSFIVGRLLTSLVADTEGFMVILSFVVISIDIILLVYLSRATSTQKDVNHLLSVNQKSILSGQEILIRMEQQISDSISKLQQQNLEMQKQNIEKKQMLDKMYSYVKTFDEREEIIKKDIVNLQKEVKEIKKHLNL